MRHPERSEGSPYNLKVDCTEIPRFGTSNVPSLGMTFALYMDQRHLRRIKIIQNLFAYSFDKLSHNLPYPEETKTQKIIEKLEKIDQFIRKFAPRYPLKNIAKTDLSILRMSAYELLFENKTPKKVTINEAIELAKELSGEKSYAFINAVLGKILAYAKS